MSLMTWNTRGKAPTALYLNQAVQNFPAGPLRNLIPDFVCIQEAGDGGWGGHVGPAIPCGWNPAPSFASYHQIVGVALGVTPYNGYAVRWQANIAGNERCTLVLLWQAALGAHAVMPVNGWHDGVATHRPVFWVTPAGMGAVRVGCIHAPSGGGGATQANITGAIANVQAGAPAGGWRLAGDFNIAPNLLVVPAGVVTQNTGHQTHQAGGELDYLLRQGAPAFANCASAGAYVGNSDHLQIRYA